MGEALSDQEPGSGSTRLIHFATITSRVDAFVLRSALEHEGIHVWMGAEHHAGVDPMAQALGGYRLEIVEADWAQASSLARELAWPDAGIIYEGQKRAVQRVLALLLGYQFFWTVPAIIMGALPASMIGFILVGTATGTRVDPRGPNQFHLVEAR